MKNTLFYFALILSVNFVNTSCVQNKKEQNQLNDFVYLFDGTNANQWRGFQSDSLPANWLAQDGNLVTLGHGGDLGGDIITKKNYEDFDLSLEWAISKGGNSGIFFHVLEGEYPTVYATGPEYQLIDDPGFPSPLEEWQKTGADYAMYNADNSKKELMPVGEFNTSRIRVKDGRVTYWLNGEKIVEYELWTDAWKERVKNSKWKDYVGYGLARKGHIGLQDHGSLVKFRNIKIKDLTEKGKPLFNGTNLEGWKIHGTEKWYVENGNLVCESGPDKQYGYLATDTLYNDFILRLKFKQESDGNSGVFFRSVLNGTNIKGWQVEVAPENFDSGGIYESGGRGWMHQIPEERENILKPGEWNDMTIKVEGERVMVWLNNELMTDLSDEKIGEGKGMIALQIHSGEDVKIRWKDIYLKRLKE
ncbi:MAG: DUF1080 domain-containing protein [Bacteroidota bacterium]|nr:DUF1080 domain-containing protein [Bacteroidota bacterium]